MAKRGQQKSQKHEAGLQAILGELADSARKRESLKGSRHESLLDASRAAQAWPDAMWGLAHLCETDHPWPEVVEVIARNLSALELADLILGNTETFSGVSGSVIQVGRETYANAHVAAASTIRGMLWAASLASHPTNKTPISFLQNPFPDDLPARLLALSASAQRRVRLDIVDCWKLHMGDRSQSMISAAIERERMHLEGMRRSRKAATATEGEDPLVDVDQIAQITLLEVSSLKKFRPGWPKPFRKGQGRAKSKWRYSELLPILKKQMPNTTFPDTLPP